MLVKTLAIEKITSNAQTTMSIKRAALLIPGLKRSILLWQSAVANQRWYQRLRILGRESPGKRHARS
jgi:hypothetical protein